MQHTLKETLALFRYANARLAQHWCQWQFDRSARALEQAVRAVDKAWADVRATELPPVDTEAAVPRYLQRAAGERQELEEEQALGDRSFNTAEGQHFYAQALQERAQ